MGVTVILNGIIHWLITKFQMMSGIGNWIIVLDRAHTSFVNHHKFIPEHLIAFLCQHGILPFEDWQEIKEQDSREREIAKLFEIYKHIAPDLNILKEALQHYDMHDLIYILETEETDIVPDLSMKRKTEEIKTKLSELYRTYFEKISPFPSDQSFEKLITSVPKELTNLKADAHPELTDYPSCLAMAFQSGRPVIIEGAAGLGKTTLTHRLCYEWATQPGLPFLKNYDIVLFTPLRSVGSSRRMIEMVGSWIADKLPSLRFDMISFLNQFLQTPVIKTKMLVILDGLDELKADCSELDQLLYSEYGRLLPFDLLITRRHMPDKCILCPRETLKLRGFEKEQKLWYIRNHFVNRPDKVRQVSHKISRYKLHRLAEVPMLLCFICLSHDRIVSERRADLYKTFMEWLIMRRHKFEGDFLLGYDNPQYGQQIINLGHLALEKLVEQSLVFKRSDLMRYNVDEHTMLDFGLLNSTHEGVGGLVSFEFAHSSVQEYFAAYCLYHMLSRSNGQFLRRMAQGSIWPIGQSQPNNGDWEKVNEVLDIAYEHEGHPLVKIIRFCHDRIGNFGLLSGVITFLFGMIKTDEVMTGHTAVMLLQLMCRKFRSVTDDHETREDAALADYYGLVFEVLVNCQVRQASETLANSRVFWHVSMPDLSNFAHNVKVSRLFDCRILGQSPEDDSYVLINHNSIQWPKFFMYKRGLGNILQYPLPLGTETDDEACKFVDNSLISVEGSVSDLQYFLSNRLSNVHNESAALSLSLIEDVADDIEFCCSNIKFVYIMINFQRSEFSKRTVNFVKSLLRNQNGLRWLHLNGHPTRLYGRGSKSLVQEIPSNIEYLAIRRIRLSIRAQQAILKESQKLHLHTLVQRNGNISIDTIKGFLLGAKQGGQIKKLIIRDEPALRDRFSYFCSLLRDWSSLREVRLSKIPLDYQHVQTLAETLVKLIEKQTKTGNETFNRLLLHSCNIGQFEYDTLKQSLPDTVKLIL